MKRFTETEKWNNPNFRRLSDAYKLLYLFLLDECDHAGVMHIDLERFEFVFKRKFTIEEIKENLGDKIYFFGKDKLALVGFIGFQCGKLSEKCAPHRKILQLIEKHKLQTELEMGII